MKGDAHTLEVIATFFELPRDGMTTDAYAKRLEWAMTLRRLGTSLAEAEALIRKNVELMNGYLARIAELENIICGPLASITEILEKTNADLIASNVVQMWKDENQTLKTQIAALQEIAIEQKAMRICTIPANWWNEGEQVKEYFRMSARRRLAKEHPEAFR